MSWTGFSGAFSVTFVLDSSSWSSNNLWTICCWWKMKVIQTSVFLVLVSVTFSNLSCFLFPLTSWRGIRFVLQLRSPGVMQYGDCCVDRCHFWKEQQDVTSKMLRTESNSLQARKPQIYRPWQTWADVECWGLFVESISFPQALWHLLWRMKTTVSHQGRKRFMFLCKLREF